MFYISIEKNYTLMSLWFLLHMYTNIARNPLRTLLGSHRGKNKNIKAWPKKKEFLWKKCNKQSIVKQARHLPTFKLRVHSTILSQRTCELSHNSTLGIQQEPNSIIPSTISTTSPFSFLFFPRRQAIDHAISVCSTSHQRAGCWSGWADGPRGVSHIDVIVDLWRTKDAAHHCQPQRPRRRRLAAVRRGLRHCSGLVSGRIRKKGRGGAASGSGRRRCACGKEFAKSYIAGHRKKCTAAARAQEVVERRSRVYKGERFVCVCSKEMAKTNKFWHEREACPQRWCTFLSGTRRISGFR